MRRIPHGDAAGSVHGGNLPQFDNGAADREMIPVIVVHIQESVGHGPAAKGVGIGGIRTDQLRKGRKIGRFDGYAFLLNKVPGFINGPDSLRF